MSAGLSNPEVVIVGAGPAGAVAALQLAPTRRVVVVDARRSPGPRIGESLPPAAAGLLGEMGLLDSFQRAGHERYFANRSVWGSALPQEHDFMQDLAGPGWHIDRARFELWLRDLAVEKGAALLIAARVMGVEAAEGGWRVALEGGRVLTCGFLIDAGGRSAPLARKLGATICRQDRLVCRWIRGSAGRAGAGLSYIEAVEDGWWYTAPLPGGRRVLAFHTDSDLPAIHRTDLMAEAALPPGLALLLAEAGFVSDGDSVVTPANSAVLEPAVGTSWLATGDAALSFDPLSSQGLLNALFTGRAGGQAAARHLAGSSAALSDYAAILAGIHADYRRQLSFWYGAESRWPDSLFWRRRQGDEAGSTGSIATPSARRR